MFKSIFSFFFPVSVDSVVGDLKRIQTQLEGISDVQKSKIEDLRLDLTAAELEKKRADKIADNFTKLLGGE